MTVAPNLTPEEQELLKVLRRAQEEAKTLPPPSQRFQDRMQSEADASAAMARPGPVRDLHLKIEAMSQAEFEAEFGHVIYANAYDEDEDDVPDEDAE